MIKKFDYELGNLFSTLDSLVLDLRPWAFIFLGFRFLICQKNWGNEDWIK